MEALGDSAWLALHEEEIVDPDREIVDPHHHLWVDLSGSTYQLEHLRADTGTGHNVVQTVFVECGAEYHTDGPEHLRSVGETEYVARVAAESAKGSGATIAGIVAYTDLREEALGDILDAHESAGSGLFRGIRDALARADHPGELRIPGEAPAGLFEDADFLRGVGTLGKRGLPYDSWNYHYQLSELAAVARAAPDTTVVLDHFGTPLGVGSYADKREEIFAQWKIDLAELASLENVVAKLGGLAMPDNGFGFYPAEKPPTSDDLVRLQSRYYLHAIECFGPERCMFESNFPVDRLSVSYAVFFNAAKKMVADFSESEKNAMFSGTARRVYRLPSV